MTPRHVFPLALALIFTTPACSSGDCFDASTPGCIVTSAEQRIQSPSVTDAQRAAAVAGNTAFAASLYRELRTEPGNLFYAPFSISSALAMAYAGARGDTEAQMATALGFSLPQAELHPAFNALDLALRSRAHEASGEDGAVRLEVANALWGQMGQPFQAPFLDTLATSYGAGVRIANFAKEHEAARELINDWAAEATEDRIEELMPEGVVDQSTRLVLANAVSFGAAWATPFDEASTRARGFERRDGVEVQVATMAAERRTPYAAGSDWEAVELPYVGHELSMVLVLPARGRLDAFEASLTGDTLSAITHALVPHEVDMTLPRVRVTSQLDLAARLGALGMVDAFGGAADFSGIDGTRSLLVGAVVHQAFVEMNEAGTEAAAATGVEIEPKSTIPHAEIHLDRPYLFFIRDVATETILFLGRVEDPSG